MHKLALLFVFSTLVVETGCPKALPKVEKVKYRKIADAATLRKTRRPVATPEQKRRLAASKRSAAIKRAQLMRSALVTLDEKKCTQDKDCTLTPFHCCACTANGALVGVRAEVVPNLISRRAAACGNQVCSQIMSSDKSCEAKKAVCVKGLCVPDSVKDAPAMRRPSVRGSGGRPRPTVNRAGAPRHLGSAASQPAGH